MHFRCVTSDKLASRQCRLSTVGINYLTMIQVVKLRRVFEGGQVALIAVWLYCIILHG